MHFIMHSDGGFSPLAIREIGFARDREITRFGPGQRNAYIVHYVLKGKGWYNGSPVGSGQGFLIFPGQSAFYYPDEEDPWEFLWIISYGDSMGPIFERYCADPDTLIFSFDPEGLSVLNRTAGMLVSGEKSIVDSLVILETYLHILNSCAPSVSGAKSTPNAEVYLDFAENYIEDHISRPVTVLELTKLLGISQPYLYRIFQKKYLMSPKQYILFCKLQHAKKLLTETTLSITEIAHSVGYPDVLAFSRLFSRKEKCSPQQYRKSRQTL